MQIPQIDRKKALIVVDVQKGFLDTRNKYVVANILELLKTTLYDRYVAAIFHAEKGSLWEKQQDWTFPIGEKTNIEPAIAVALEKLHPITVEKETRSVFKGIPNVAELLRTSGIEEVHIVGFETHDCILATAFESFDSGFFTYVIEECCESTDADMHAHGLALLRRQNMTNHSAV